MYYVHPVLTEGRKITGRELKTLIRTGCSYDTFGKKVKNIPLSSIVNAIKDQKFEKKQIMDFLTRLRSSILPVNPIGYNYSIGEYLISDLGRATALDHHVNRPGYVRRDIGHTLDEFFNKNPTVSQNPANWGDSRAIYESEIVDSYGRSRAMAKPGGVPVAPVRYAALKSRLN
jgi:hypothetical protein